MATHATLPVGLTAGMSKSSPVMSASQIADLSTNLPATCPGPESDIEEASGGEHAHSRQSPCSSSPSRSPIITLPAQSSSPHQASPGTTTPSNVGSPSSLKRSSPDLLAVGPMANGAPPAKRQKLTPAEREVKRKEKEEVEQRRSEEVSFVVGCEGHRTALTLQPYRKRSVKRRSDSGTWRNCVRRKSA